MRKCILAAGLATALAAAAAAQDGGLAWLDAFEDGSVRDGSSVPWVEHPTLPGSMEVVRGDLVLGVTVRSGPFFVGGVEVPLTFDSGASIRARVQASTAPVAAGLSFLEPERIAGYVGYVDDRGLVVLLRADEDGRVAPIGSAKTPFRSIDELLLQLDVFAGQVALTAWAPGSPKPQPQVQVEDDTFSAGWAGCFVQDLSCELPIDATASFRFVQASSTPLTHSDLGDLDADGVVGGADLGLLLANWTDASCAADAAPCVGDLDGDRLVNGSDLGLLLANWG